MPWAKTGLMTVAVCSLCLNPATGVQVSVFGLLVVTLGLAEGIELNILGLSFGVDILRPAIKLPAVGRLGFKDAPVFKD
jgi:hypothetical protein